LDHSSLGDGDFPSKMLRLARVAEGSNNYEEGNKYYSQVLEHDQDNVEAWLGKARCIAWRTSVKSQTINEAILYVLIALDINKPDEESIYQTVWNISLVTSAYMKLVGDYLTEKIDYPFEETRPDPIMAMLYGLDEQKANINALFIHIFPSF
jgi:hypothetical protein